MSSAVDLIAVVILLIFTVSGWRKGFFRTVIGPVSLAAGLFLGTLYYQKAQNMIVCFSIFVLGPFAVSIVLSGLLLAWHKIVSKGEVLSSSSRITGGLLGLLWGLFILIPAVLLLSATPLQEKISPSRIYGFTENTVRNYFPSLQDLENMLVSIRDPEKLEELRSNPEFEKIYRDEAIQRIASDREIAEAFKTKNILKILTNSKIHAALRNKELVKKIVDLNTNVFKKNLP